MERGRATEGLRGRGSPGFREGHAGGCPVADASVRRLLGEEMRGTEGLTD